MKLTFSNSYLSIKELPDCELPDFTILTGVNGCGKSQLLEAIERGHVKIDAIQNLHQEIKKFDSSNFVLRVDANASPHSLHQQRIESVEHIWAARNQVISNLRSYINRYIADFKSEEWLLCVNEYEMASSLADQPIKHVNEKAVGRGYVTHRSSLLEQFEASMEQYGSLLNNLEKIIHKKSIPHILLLGKEDYREALPPFWNGSQGILQLQLSSWFAAWHASSEYNKINQYYANQGEDRQWLPPKDFEEKYGPEPWLLTNKILENAGVRYRFNKPTHKLDELHSNFNLELIDPEDGNSIPLNSLSSGEKVILSIILLLFQTTEKAILAPLPKILLLDEVDAPLHPSFTKTLIQIINDELVKRCGISVIMTTHSPSTVALAPQHSVYELTRKPRALQQISAGAAAQVLSSGFVALAPTDAIVITESGADIGFYEKTHLALCRLNKIPTFPDIKFVSASKPRSDGEGGCSEVKKWAPKLAELGIGRIRGLIDRDSGATSDAVVSVLSRYSWENYLFDPITIASYLLHRGISLPINHSPVTAIELINLGGNDLQRVLNEFLDWMSQDMGIAEACDNNRMILKYHGWERVFLPIWWVNTRGHDLEHMVRISINKISNKQKCGAIIKHGNYGEWINFQSVIFPQLISEDMVDIFKNLKS